MIDLASRLMIVNISISVWEGRKLDRTLTRKTIEEAHVKDEDALRVNKLLITKDAFKEVQSCTSEIRLFVRERTMPWKDQGDRALMRNGFAPFMEGFHEREKNWHAAVDRFVGVKYPAEMAKASFRLADAFDLDDYPHPEELRMRFRLTLDIDAVTDANDFRVKLDDDTVKDIQDRIRSATEQRVHAAMKDVWERVESMVQHFADRTTPDIQRFHDTTVTNLNDLVDLLPSLNLIGDPKLREIQKRLKETLCGYDPKDLRKNEVVRAAANTEAQRIIEDMEGWMNALR